MEVVQVIPQDDYKVIVYFVDGAVKKYDVSHLVGEGIFEYIYEKGENVSDPLLYIA